jgi:hypothetical protein
VQPKNGFFARASFPSSTAVPIVRIRLASFPRLSLRTADVNGDFTIVGVFAGDILIILVNLWPGQENGPADSAHGRYSVMERGWKKRNHRKTTAGRLQADCPNMPASPFSFRFGI